LSTLDIILEILKQAGLAGLAAIMTWLWIRKDRQVTRLYDRLEAKTEKYSEKYSALSAELNETVGALTEALNLDEEGG